MLSDEATRPAMPLSFCNLLALPGSGIACLQKERDTLTRATADHTNENQHWSAIDTIRDENI
jgi:hypothetical protein